MKTTKRIAMCLVLMGLFTTMTGCEDVISGAVGGIFDEVYPQETVYVYDPGVYGGYWDTGYYDDWGTGYDEEWDTGSSSGTFFSDYGGSLSWW